MELGMAEILIGIGILLLSLYYYASSNFDYWKNLNVEGPKPFPYLGNFKNAMFGTKHPTLLIQEFYEEFKNQPLIGVYSLRNPTLIVKDLDLIKDVLIKDFNVFADRGIEIHEKVEPFCLNIFNLEYERWKPLRTKLTPIFNSGKVKDMFYLIAGCGEHFQKFVGCLAEKNYSVDCHELAAKFTTDSIGVCAFGLNLNVMIEEDNEFRKFGASALEPSYRNTAKLLLILICPAIYDLIGDYLQPINANEFFKKCIKETIAHRKESNVRRNDFIDLLIDLRNNPEKNQSCELTDRIITCQAYIFFLAGYHTSATTIANILYELAINQRIQDKLRQEIIKERSNCDEKLSYDCINNMKYLDQIVKEILRKYPPGTNLLRKTLASYTFRGTKLTIPKGMHILIPVWAIQRDPEIYPNPEVFDPERFNEENEKSRHPMAYLPFGDGPHNCIASRFAKYQVKVGIISIIQKLKVETCDKTCKEFRLMPWSVFPIPVGGIHVKLTKL